MKQIADEIRGFVKDTRIIPSRARGVKIIKIRAGEIRDEMKQKLQWKKVRSSNVCGALQALKFESFADVKRIAIEGPGVGTNCIMTFEIL
ncbi:hypothetical protein [uncultured Treponema sp.]|uniref:hypothetical protein n=1 Tax=uncultured Treponema sp. TaxID=162155 RepID=UPI0025CCA8F2|nr:hypothetical protein [uncultured Treponema sp.]